MIKETYVSFKTAILLKEKGFNGWCFGYYKPNREFDTYITPRTYAGVEGNYILAPTHQMAMKWLRETHNLHVDVDPSEGNWNPTILELENWSSVVEDETGLTIYDSYEEAVEAAIEYCLTNLI